MSRPARPDATDRIVVRPDTSRLACEDTPGPPFPFLLPPVEDGELGRVGQYRVLRLIGSGGMGMVFAAEDIALCRPVAIKVMRQDREGGDADGGWQRFLREARALAALKHPNLVTVYQAFQERGTVFLVMELLEGESLEAVIRRPEFPDPREVVRVGTEIATGLAALHDAGLIHRDIKPANIFLETRAEGGRRKAEEKNRIADRSDSALPAVKILDLGLVRDMRSDLHLTEAGTIVGTPAYMSPEQARGWPLDHRTDLFSLGCVLFALCTGRQPFEADTPFAQAAALAADEAPPVREFNPDIPRPLADLIARLLAKNPEDRPASAAAVIELLRGVYRPEFRLIQDAPTEPDLPREQRPKPPANRPPKSRRSKYRSKATRRRSFRHRHGLKIVTGLWLVVAGLLVAAFAGVGKERGEKAAADAKAPDAPPAELKPGDVLFLTEFPIGQRSQTPQPHYPPGFDGTIRVGERDSPHGLFMHPGPPGQPAGITYRLGKGFSRFNAEVGLNYSAPPFATPARFVVYADGKLRWESKPPLRAGDAPQACDLDVRGVNELTLDVTTEGRPEGTHAVWLEPRLTK